MSTSRARVCCATYVLAGVALIGCGSESSSNSADQAPRGSAVVLPNGKSIQIAPFGDVVEEGIVILVQPNGATIQPGSEVLVEVVAKSGFQPKSVHIWCKYDSALIESAPYRATMLIPDDAFGQLDFSAEAFDASRNLAVSPTVSLRIRPKAAMTGLHIEDPIVLFVDDREQLRVFGDFKDGVRRHIADADTGTLYESLDPAIATIDQNGVTLAKSPGVARFRVVHGRYKRVVEVPVEDLSGADPTSAETRSVGSATSKTDGGT